MDNKNVKMNSSLQAEETSMIMIKDELNEALFNTMRLGASRYDILAAYKSRQKCYKLCRKQKYIPDYKEYVEVFQLDNFPDELKKADYGKRYVKLLLCTVICAVTCVIVVVDFTCKLYYDNYLDDLAMWAHLIIAAASGGMIYYLISKMSTLSKSIRSLIK